MYRFSTSCFHDFIYLFILFLSRLIVHGRYKSVLILLIPTFLYLYFGIVKKSSPFGLVYRCFAISNAWEINDIVNFAVAECDSCNIIMYFALYTESIAFWVPAPRICLNWIISKFSTKCESIHRKYLSMDGYYTCLFREIRVHFASITTKSIQRERAREKTSEKRRKR